MYNNNCKANTPAPVYPWSVVSSEQNVACSGSSLFSRNNSNINNLNKSYQYSPPSVVSNNNSLMDSIISSKTSTNYNNRIQCRLAASMAGIKELDNLREKHRRLVQEVKNLIQFPINDVYQNSNQYVGDQGHVRSPSPAPSATEMSSNISHRSSLSMDSGCLSLASEFSHQHTFSADSTGSGGGCFSLPPSRKNSNNNTGAYQPIVCSYQVNSAVGHSQGHGATVVDQSDDEGCFVDHHRSKVYYQPQSYASLAASSGTLTQNDLGPCGSALSTMPKAVFSGYRRRGFIQNRPKSLYSYPEENTVLVGGGADEEDREVVAASAGGPCGSLQLTRRRPRISRACSIQLTGFQTARSAIPPPADSVYRANRVYINSAAASSQPPTNSMTLPHALSAGCLRLGAGGRRARPTSVAVPPNMTLPNMWDVRRSGAATFTWDQVKRMLDPAFDTRPVATSSATTPTMARHHRHKAGNGVIDFFAALDNNNNDRVTSSSTLTIGRNECSVGGGSSSTASSCIAQDGNPGHAMVSRSVSSQSSDSSKSSRRKEKPWRESEQL